MFKPKLISTLKDYTRAQFFNDLIAGVVVGIVALPLAIAFGIASGVSPEKGIITAIIAGFIISALGGSRVQIGGPTGAFIVIVYGIIQIYGIVGLTIATFMAGIMLIIMGVAKLGSVIKFIPHPLIVGFTSGIALIIFSTQIKDFFGFEIPNASVEFIDKWGEYFSHFSSINYYAVIVSFGTVVLILGLAKLNHKIPGSLVAILLFTFLTYILKWPIETIGLKYGVISSSIPAPVFPDLNFNTIQNLIQPAFTIAILCAMESLLSAVVADGMIGGNHRSNTELIAQGIANMFSSIFGGLPATGAIARTATNIKNGGRTPVAGIIHAITLLLILLFVGQWAVLIPIPCLAGILIVVAYNMSEWRSFLGILKGPKSDIAILLSTFFLTVLVDLTVAIEIGMILSAFLFIKKMSQISNINIVTNALNDDELSDTLSDIKSPITKGIEIFEIEGPFFFGAASKFTDALKIIERNPKVLIIRMRNVPFIDGTGLNTFDKIQKEMANDKVKLILTEVNADVLIELKKSKFEQKIGAENIIPEFENAIIKAQEIVHEH